MKGRSEEGDPQESLHVSDFQNLLSDMVGNFLFIDMAATLYSLTLYSINTHFDASTTDRFENIVGKGDIACKEQFILFPQCFLLNQIIVSLFVHIFDILSLFAAEFEEPKICISGKGLNILSLQRN